MNKAPNVLTILEQLIILYGCVGVCFLVCQK